MRHPDLPLFIANAENADFPQDRLPLFRKELTAQGADFLTIINDNLFRKTQSRHFSATPQPLRRVGVTVFYHEKKAEKAKKKTPEIRRNFKRRHPKRSRP
jgi:hypothetical protein